MLNDALKECVKWLKSADLTEAEIADRLATKGYDSNVIASVVEQLKNRTWVNDQRVAERQAEIAKQKLVGRLKVEQTLEKRQVAEDKRESVLEDFDDASEAQRAHNLLDQRLKEGDGIAKAARILGSRGFTEEVIRSVLESRYPDDF